MTAMKKNLMDRKKLVNVSIVSAIVFLVITVLYTAGFFTRLESIVYDGIVRSTRLKKPASEKVAVILIDEESLRALDPIVGRWPWPRAIFSDLLDFLSMGGPRAVLFDILFTEKQKDIHTPGMSKDDKQLVLATKETGFVYHAMRILRDEADEYNKALLNPPLPEDLIEKFSLKNIKADSGYKEENNNYYLPFKELRGAAKGMAIVEFSPDGDGVYRRTVPIRGYQGSFYPVMGIAPFLENKAIEMRKEWIGIDGKRVPLDGGGKYALNFYGEFNPYSISGIFASLQSIRSGAVENIIVDPAEFKDKIVFVGASAVGVEDLKSTPINARTPGVYLHATLASNFLLNDFLAPPNRGVTILILFLFTMVCISGIFFMKKFSLKISVPAVVAFAWVAFCLFRVNRNVLYEFVPPLIAVFASTLVSFGYLVITEGKEKLRVRKMFSQYVSPECLSVLIDKYKDYAAMDMGSRVDITALFSDIRGFTSFSDRTPPEKVVEMLNCFFSTMSDVIFNNKGTIDKFIGDEIMAFWGAPLNIPDHPDVAVMSALKMLKKLKSLNAELRDRGFDFELKIGIGINSGDAILGNIGCEKKLNYTVVGDTINLASRLQGLTKVYGCPVIISEFTYNRLKVDIPCRVIDSVRVRGKQEMIKIYEPFFFEDEKSMSAAGDLCRITNEAFELYQKGDYRKALEHYYTMTDCGLKDIFVKRCREALDADNA